MMRAARLTGSPETTGTPEERSTSSPPLATPMCGWNQRPLLEARPGISWRHASATSAARCASLSCATIAPNTAITRAPM